MKRKKMMEKSILQMRLMPRCVYRHVLEASLGASGQPRESSIWNVRDCVKKSKVNMKMPKSMSMQHKRQN